MAAAREMTYSPGLPGGVPPGKPGLYEEQNETLSG
jgi:hypothetical protein